MHCESMAPKKEKGGCECQSTSVWRLCALRPVQSNPTTEIEIVLFALQIHPPQVNTDVAKLS